jgi:hypothetical protein
MNYNRLIISLLLMTILLASCAGRAGQRVATDTAVSNTENAVLKPQREFIQRLVDEILLALAAHDYDRMGEFVEPSEPHLSGREIAMRLLGSRAFSLILDAWNAQHIKVSFDDDLLWATAQLDVSVRTSPNRQPKTVSFSFRLHRPAESAPWRLHVR